MFIPRLKHSLVVFDSQYVRLATIKTAEGCFFVFFSVLTHTVSANAHHWWN